LYPSVQSQKPAFLSVQVFVKATPGFKTVPSGIVSSDTNKATSQIVPYQEVLATVAEAIGAIAAVGIVVVVAAVAVAARVGVEGWAVGVAAGADEVN
jgi:hypothetical protein